MRSAAFDSVPADNSTPSLFLKTLNYPLLCPLCTLFSSLAHEHTHPTSFPLCFLSITYTSPPMKSLNCPVTCTTKMSKFDNTTLKRRTMTPSFSSILLDAINRSIDLDESPTPQEDNNNYSYGNSFFLRDSDKQSSRGRSDSVVTATAFSFEEETVNLRRAIMINNWMERQQQEDADEKVRAVREKSVPERKVPCSRSSVLFNSTASSYSDSSSGGKSSYTGTDFSCFTRQIKPAKVRTSMAPRSEDRLRFEHTPTKLEGRFTKTKLRALKIYSDLKRVKQPNSPVSRIASFLNSIFNAKKPNTTVSEMRSKRKSKSSSSACSSGSSFSQSCLSKTPASRGKSNNEAKRSVRFYPVSVIVDEDSRPCGHKCLHEAHSRLIPSINATKSTKMASNYDNKPLFSYPPDASKYNIEVERNIVRSACQKTTERVEKFPDADSDEEMDDDAASYASSDLFELENLSSIGVGRYDNELPVYGTTSLERNHAIANGF
ncbi:hypothetical protein Nepgr_025180 [Nepenthes gracilis]|uniref:Protein BIG GRAIN 1-like B n=1 Tax=Nepenthes gracilis TaxID=150966 RepID=A0AAD3XZA7_NEPGR|nr:hypothetical protein Nepgr_025180 [Nepenthes gracilis]